MSCVVSRAHERLVRLVRLVRTLTLSQTRNFSTHRGRVTGDTIFMWGTMPRLVLGRISDRAEHGH